MTSEPETCRSCGAPWTAETAPFCAACYDELEHLNRLYYGELGMCGCNLPETGYELVRDLLALAPFYEGTWKDAQKLIGSDGAFQIVIGLLSHIDLLEHGGTIGGSWITAKGKYYLALMRKHGYRAMDEVGLPHGGDDCPEDCPQRLACLEDWQKR